MHSEKSPLDTANISTQNIVFTWSNSVLGTFFFPGVQSEKNRMINWIVSEIQIMWNICKLNYSLF